jgi:lysozyme
MRTSEGIDIAGTDHGPIDWTGYKRSGRSFAIARANYKLTPDTDFPAFWPEMKRAGLVRGAYLFWDPIRDPVKLANAVWATVAAAGGIGPGDLPIAVDVESRHGLVGSGYTPQQALEGLTATVDELERLMGISPLIYTSRRVWMEDLKNIAAPSLARCPLWVARWSSADPLCPDVWGKGNWWLHQYAGDTGGVPGVSRPSDLDRFRHVSEGDTGAAVKFIQTKLGLDPTGTFDDTTLSAVHELQEAHGLRIDGVVGPITWSYLVWQPPP